LVIGSRRSNDSESRETLARDAYGGLISPSFWHRWTQRGFLALALLVTLLAVRESSKVALGRAYMQNLAGLRAQQVNLAAEKAQVEGLAKSVERPNELLDKTNADTVALSAFKLCDRKIALDYYLRKAHVDIPRHPSNPTGQGNKGPKIPQDDSLEASQERQDDLLEVNSSESEREICGRDYVLQTNFQIAHDALRNYAANWPEMMGPAAMTVRMARGFRKANAGRQHEDELNDPRKQDIEYILAPVLLVWGKYILPVIFGLLGTLIFVILDFYTKVRDNRLDPRDNWLGWVRLALGLVTGSCIGLFYSSTAPLDAGPAQSVSAALSLSVSGIAFLAGFGVEGVFSMLQTLVSRVFIAAEEARKYN
jgi:hypothetical protein